MTRIHLNCDTKLKVSAINADLYCTTCDKTVEKKDTYKVGKRFFQTERSQLEEEKKKKKTRKLRYIRKENKRRNR